MDRDTPLDLRSCPVLFAHSWAAEPQARSFDRDTGDGVELRATDYSNAEALIPTTTRQWPSTVICFWILGYVRLLCPFLIRSLNKEAINVIPLVSLGQSNMQMLSPQGADFSQVFTAH